MDLVNWTCAHHIPKDHLLPFLQLQTENSQLLRVSPTPFLLPVQLPAGSCGIQAPFPSSGSRAAGTLWHVSPVLWHWRSWLYWKGENSPALQRCLKCLKQILGSVFDFGRLAGCLWNVTGFQLQVGLSGLSTGVIFKFNYKLASFWWRNMVNVACPLCLTNKLLSLPFKLI